jgi:glycogen operon protein
MTTLLLSQGIPMLLAGDEFGNTQMGNNNAYCQDNEIGWLNWNALDDEGLDFLSFVSMLIDLRRRHPVFRRPDFFKGIATSEETPLKDITWLTPEGGEMTPDDWQDSQRRAIGALLSGDPADRFISLRGYRELDDTFLLLCNAHDRPVTFTLPHDMTLDRWSLILETTWPPLLKPGATFAGGASFPLAQHSLSLLVHVPQS